MLEADAQRSSVTFSELRHSSLCTYRSTFAITISLASLNPTRVYFDPASSETTRESVGLIIQVFNQYAGVAIGEHLGYLFTTLWTVFLGMAMLKRPFHKPWLARIGFVLAIGILFGMLEPAGVAWAGMVNFIAFTLWAFWLMALGVVVFRDQSIDVKGLNTLSNRMIKA